PPYAPRALVVGPDVSAAEALRAARKAPSGSPVRAIGIVETTGSDVGRDIEGVQVIGSLDQLASLFDHYTARYGEMPRLPIARPREDRRTMEAALAVASARKATLIRMASNQNALLEAIRPADLLARPERRLDMAPVVGLVSGARVFITGGGGT